MALDMNFAEKPFRNYTLFYTLFTICTALVFVLTMYNILTYLQNRKEYSEYADIIQSGDERKNLATKESNEIEAEIEKEDRKELLKNVNFVNENIRLRTFSWTDFFNELEKQLPPGVKLIYIRPRGKDENVQIYLKFTAKTMEEALTFFDNLTRSTSFEYALPKRESKNQAKRNYTDWQITLNYLPGKAGLPDMEEETETGAPEALEEEASAEGAGFILDTGRLSVTGLPFLPDGEAVESLPALDEAFPLESGEDTEEGAGEASGDESGEVTEAPAEQVPGEGAEEDAPGDTAAEEPPAFIELD